MFADSLALVGRELALVKTDRKGVTALEYGLLAGLIAVVILVAVTVVGTQIDAVFTTIGNTLTAVNG